MRRLMLALVLVGLASSVGAEERAFDPCAWMVQAKVLHMNNDPSTDPTTTPAMSWTVKGIAVLVGSAEQASDLADSYLTKGVWSPLSPPYITPQRATLYPPHMIQSVLIQGPTDTRCDPAVSRKPVAGRRER